MRFEKACLISKSCWILSARAHVVVRIVVSICPNCNDLSFLELWAKPPCEKFPHMGL